MSPLAPQDHRQVRIRGDARVILRDRIAIERFLVLVNERLPKRETGQQQQHSRRGHRQRVRQVADSRAARSRDPPAARQTMRQAGVILKVVRDEGVAEGIDVEKSQCRRQHAAKDQRSRPAARDQCGAPPPTAPRPGPCRGGKEILPPHLIVDVQRR